MPRDDNGALFPGLLADAFAISVGAAYKSVEMMMNPRQSAETMVSEMTSLMAVPAEAGEGLEAKAQAIAAVWMAKGATLLNDCKTAGQKLTEGS